MGNIMKKILVIIVELLRIFKKAFSEVNKKRKEKEISDVREAIKETDLNKLRDLILNRK